MTLKSISPSRCPLCGEPNACANLVEKCNPADCWCHQADIIFSKTLLDTIPLADRGKACICQRCVTKHQANELAN